MGSYKDAVERLETAAGDVAAANFKRMGDREKVLAAQKVWTARAMVAVMLLTILCGVGLSVQLARSVTRPILQAVRLTEAIARGDLAVSVPEVGRDEVGQLLKAMGQMAGRLRGVVAEVRSGADALTQTSGQVVSVVGQVSSASSQVSASAQTLSQGTSEQAASVQETTSSLEEMSASITQNAENSRQMEQMALQGARDGQESARSVDDTVNARSPRRSRSSRRSRTRRTCSPSMPRSRRPEPANTAAVSPWSRRKSASSPSAVRRRPRRSAASRPRR